MGDKYCAGCLRHSEENVADAWCSDCSEFVCKPCAKVHLRFGRPHTVVPHQEVGDLNASLLHIDKHCDIHTEQPIVLFCTQHDKMICDLCLSDGHSKCKYVISIERAAKDVKEGSALEDLQKRMMNLTEILTSVTKEKAENSSVLDTQRKEILQQITDVRGQIETHLYELENEVKKELNTEYEFHKKKTEDDRNYLERRSSKVQNMINDTASLKKIASEVHFFQVLKEVDAKIQREEMEMQNQDSLVYLKFHTDENVSKFPGMLKSLGQITVKRKSVTIPQTKGNVKQIHVSKVEDKIGRKVSLTKSEDKVGNKINTGVIRHKHSFMTSKLRLRATTITGSFISNKQLLLIDVFEPFLYVCNYDGTEAERIQLKYIPWSVAMIDSSRAIVTLQKFGFKVIDLTTHKLGKRIKPGGHGCYGTTVKNGKILVEDLGNKILNITIDGTVVRETTTKYRPWDLCMNNYGDLYYTASQNNTIQKITAQGQEMTFFSHPDTKYLRGIDIDNFGNVFVAAINLSNILKISPDGNTYQVILGTDDEIHSPVGLRKKNDKDEILIFNNDGRSVEFYDMKE